MLSFVCQVFYKKIKKSAPNMGQQWSKWSKNMKIIIYINFLSCQVFFFTCAIWHIIFCIMHKKIILYPKIYKKYIIPCPICGKYEHDIAHFLSYIEEKKIIMKCSFENVFFEIYACNGEIYQKIEIEEDI